MCLPIRIDLPRPKLEGLTAAPDIPPVTELSAKPPQSPEDLPNVTVPSPPNKQQQQAAAASPSPSPSHQRSNSAAKSNTLRPAMDDPEDDPWNSPEMHKGHAHTKQNGISNNASSSAGTQNGFGHSSQSSQPYNSTSGVSTSPTAARRSSGSGGWGDYGDSGNGLSAGGGFGNNSNNDPFGGDGASGQTPGGNQPPANPINPIRSVSGRTGNGIEESVRVTLMPGKEGIFMFQHHNYEVSSHRRESKVIRRYSDFVWLLDCLQKRYPFRVLPLLPPKRVAVNGNHLSNDGSFIEKRRRGLSRFLNALVRHPILSQEQLVIMFLTVPTVSKLNDCQTKTKLDPTVTLIQRCRNLQSGASSRLFPCKTSLRIATCLLAWKIHCLQRWKTCLVERGAACAGPLSCTSTCVTSWTVL